MLQDALLTGIAIKAVGLFIQIYQTYFLVLLSFIYYEIILIEAQGYLKLYSQQN